jgi:hypothetical protein
MEWRSLSQPRQSKVASIAAELPLKADHRIFHSVDRRALLVRPHSAVECIAGARTNLGTVLGRGGKQLSQLAPQHTDLSPMSMSMAVVQTVSLFSGPERT